MCQIPKLTGSKSDEKEKEPVAERGPSLLTTVNYVLTYFCITLVFFGKTLALRKIPGNLHIIAAFDGICGILGHLSSRCLSHLPHSLSPSRYSDLRLWMPTGAIYGRLLFNYANCVSGSCIFQYTRSTALFELDVLPHLGACLPHHSLSPYQPIYSFWRLYVCVYVVEFFPAQIFLTIAGMRVSVLLLGLGKQS